MNPKRESFLNSEFIPVGEGQCLTYTTFTSMLNLHNLKLNDFGVCISEQTEYTFEESNHSILINPVLLIGVRLRKS